MNNNNKLITIELDNQESVPKVFYKGEEITGGKVKVQFNWETDECEKKPVNFYIEHAETDGDNIPVIRTISSNKEYMNREEFNKAVKKLNESQDRIAKRLDNILKRFEKHESGDGNELSD
ncbi:hypothetical protein MHI39_08150 [Heyndrickxia sp. FSL K6-6286]|uniref:hypothetical protein n=1 Tax=Heyndrickxia sp. FSL K6-6286 TaxID=2921510 RepID=UPI00315A5839